MPFAHLTPALETLAGSRALTALAHAQKRLREQTEEDEIQKLAAKKFQRNLRRPKEPNPRELTGVCALQLYFSKALEA